MDRRWFRSDRPYVPRRALAAVIAMAGALFAVLLATAAPASAHAALLRTDPASGSVVQSAPRQIVLTFSEGVLLSADSLRVLSPTGENVAVGTPGHAAGKDSGSTAEIGLKPGLVNGTYTVAWKAVSQDSHPVSGAFTFSVGAPSRTTVDVSAQAAAGGGTAGTLYGVARYVAYGGFALLVGGSVFLSVCWPRGAALRPLRRLAGGGWVALVASTIALIMLRGPYVNGSGLGDAFDLDVIRAQVETRPGAALVSRLLLLAAAAVFLAVLFGTYTKRDDPEERADLAWGLGIGGSVVTVGIAATWAMAEHASVGIQHEVAMPVDVVHLVSMAVWLGGLVTLLTALSLPAVGGTVERAAVQRFSTVALTAMTLLVGTGVYQSWRQLGSWRAFTDTSYGKLLLAKIGLVGALVCVAWFSRRWTRALGAPAAAGSAGSSGNSAGSTGKAGRVGRQKSRPAARRTPRQAVVAAVGAAESDGVPEGAQEAVQGSGGGAEAAAGAGAGDAGGKDGGGGGGGRGGKERKDGRDAKDAKDGKDAKDTAPVDPRRSAQLRRQRAARDAARERKARDADPARLALRRSVLAEAGIAVVLMAVATTLSGSQPGRAAEEQKALAAASPAATPSAAPTSLDVTLRIPFDTGGPGGKGTATVTLTPARAAVDASVHLELADDSGRSVKAPEVRLAFTLPAQHLGPLQAKVAPFGAGHWIASGLRLPLAGDWQMSLTVRTSDIDEVTVTRTVQVAS